MLRFGRAITTDERAICPGPLPPRNVKIITIDGRITLRGPVATAEEKCSIGEIADRIAHSENVDNQLEVNNPTKSN